MGEEGEGEMREKIGKKERKGKKLGKSCGIGESGG